MISELEALIKLQWIDVRISELVRAREGFPATIASLEAHVKKAQDGLDALIKKHNDLLHEKKTIEAAISDAKAQLDKSQELLNTIKTNREYDAVHTQIENFKHIVSGGDARLRNFDNEAEQLLRSIDNSKAELDKITSESGPKFAEIQSAMDTMGSSISQAVAERDQLVALVPKSLLRTYDYILKRRKNGQVLSFVDGGKRTCSVCFKILEPQLINEIRKANTIITCQNCGSIFVWKDEAQLKS